MPKTKDKPKNTKATLRSLLDYIKEFHFFFVLAILLTFAANSLQLLGPYYTGKIIDLIKLNSETSLSQILSIIWLMVAVYIVSSILLYALNALMIVVSQKIVVKMRGQLFTKFMDLPARYFDNHQIGDMISRISYDIDTINTSLSSDVVQFFGSSIMSCVYWIFRRI